MRVLNEIAFDSLVENLAAARAQAEALEKLVIRAMGQKKSAIVGSHVILVNRKIDRSGKRAKTYKALEMKRVGS